MVALNPARPPPPPPPPPGDRAGGGGGGIDTMQEVAGIMGGGGTTTRDPPKVRPAVGHIRPTRFSPAAAQLINQTARGPKRDSRTER